MKMNKYPGIYKALDGTVYYYLNKSNFFSPERDRWEEDCDNDDHKADVNITAEYLINTYGKVESKEHAEFIKLIADNHGIKCNYMTVIDELKYFYFSGGVLFFTFGRIDHDRFKLITIPLPPKESEAKITTESVVAGDSKTYDVTPLSEWQGGEVKFRKVGYVEKEWPAVGDEVLTESNTKAIVLGFHENLVWVKYTKGNCGYNTVSIARLKKPLTSKDELDAKLYDFFQCNSTEDLAEAIINGEIEGLEYKPQ